MYNGIGLQTARGSGTNGYVTRNLAFVHTAKEKIKYKTEEEIQKLDSISQKKPNLEILDHERKRKLELKCLELQDELEDQGLSEEVVESRLVEFRAVLMQKAAEEGKGTTSFEADKYGRIVVRETHQIAEAQAEKNKSLRQAFGISEYFVEGSSLDPQRRFRESAAKAAAEQKTYTIVRTPSPEKEPAIKTSEQIVVISPSKNDKNKKNKKEKKKKSNKKDIIDETKTREKLKESKKAPSVSDDTSKKPVNIEPQRVIAGSSPRRHNYRSPSRHGRNDSHISRNQIRGNVINRKRYDRSDEGHSKEVADKRPRRRDEEHQYSGREERGDQVERRSYSRREAYMSPDEDTRHQLRHNNDRRGESVDRIPRQENQAEPKIINKEDIHKGPKVALESKSGKESTIVIVKSLPECIDVMHSAENRIELNKSEKTSAALQAKKMKEDLAKLGSYIDKLGQSSKKKHQSRSSSSSSSSSSSDSSLSSKSDLSTSSSSDSDVSSSSSSASSSSSSSASSRESKRRSKIKRSPSIPRRAGSPSFLDRRRITRYKDSKKYH